MNPAGFWTVTGVVYIGEPEGRQTWTCFLERVDEPGARTLEGLVIDPSKPETGERCRMTLRALGIDPDLGSLTIAKELIGLVIVGRHTKYGVEVVA